MNDGGLLKITGEVEHPGVLTLADLAGLDDAYQVADVGKLDPARKGSAVKLAGVLERAGVKPEAKFLGLHSSRDNFHASIPLGPVRDRGLLIYRLAGDALPASAGGPVRFFIPDYAACRSDEIDECANVKFVDHLELTAEKGFDNRPTDEESHAELHRGQQG